MWSFGHLAKLGKKGSQDTHSTLYTLKTRENKWEMQKKAEESPDSANFTLAKNYNYDHGNGKLKTEIE